MSATKGILAGVRKLSGVTEGAHGASEVLP